MLNTFEVNSVKNRSRKATLNTPWSIFETNARQKKLHFCMSQMIWNGANKNWPKFKRNIKTSSLLVKNNFKSSKSKLKYSILGLGKEENDAIGYDMAVMASSDHTIITRGSFSSWCSILCGGEYYTEYGLIVPLTHILDQQAKKDKKKRVKSRRY